MPKLGKEAKAAQEHRIREDILSNKDHQYRYDLTNELHARPFERIQAPAKITYYVMTSGEGNSDKDLTHIQALCLRMGVNPPAKHVSHFSADFGTFRLRWERHSEFSSYTFLKEGKFDEPFTNMPVSAIPVDWLKSIPGERIVGVNLAFFDNTCSYPSDNKLHEWLARGSLLTSKVASEEAQIWTDFQIHGDGHSRIIVHNYSLNPWKSGRVLQRLLETITYSTMAMLALPFARKAWAKMIYIDNNLTCLTAKIAKDNKGYNAAPDSSVDGDVLTQLTSLSAELERVNSSTIFRLTAARAYYALVQDRLTELNEVGVSGFQQFGSFLKRRMVPAMRTCVSVEDRQDELSQRGTRVADLLRTRVDFALERQNQKLLSTMAQRSKHQLRLQETVEGLSVAAITYYTVGLVGYLAKASKSLGININTELAQGIAIPVIAGSVWFGMKKLRKSIFNSDKEND